MRRIRFNDRLHLHGSTVLSMLLLAALVAPLPAAAWGTRLPTLVGIGRGALPLAAAWARGRTHARGGDARPLRGRARHVAIPLDSPRTDPVPVTSTIVTIP